MRIPAITVAKATALGCILLAAPGTLKSQSLWLPPTDKSSVTLEVLKPDRDNTGVKFATSVWFLSGQYRISSRMTLIAELPVVYYRAVVSGGS